MIPPLFTPLHNAQEPYGSNNNNSHYEVSIICYILLYFICIIPLYSHHDLVILILQIRTPRHKQVPIDL